MRKIGNFSSFAIATNYPLNDVEDATRMIIGIKREDSCSTYTHTHVCEKYLLLILDERKLIENKRALCMHADGILFLYVQNLCSRCSEISLN